MNLPTELRYTKTHEWVRIEGDIATVGITDYAQEALGDMVYVQAPDAGRSVMREQECAVVESVKAASDVYSPLSGTIVAKNEELDQAPQRLNEAPYDAWLFKVRLSDVSELAQLLSAEQYKQVVDSERH